MFHCFGDKFSICFVPVNSWPFFSPCRWTKSWARLAVSLSPSNLLTPTWAPKSQRLTGGLLGGEVCWYQVSPPWADRYKWSDMGPLEMAESKWVTGVSYNPIRIGSMYCIFTYIWLILMVNVSRCIYIYPGSQRPLENIVPCNCWWLVFRPPGYIYI